MVKKREDASVTTGPRDEVRGGAGILVAGCVGVRLIIVLRRGEGGMEWRE